MLTTIHVSLTINGATRKRPLRIYDASTNTFGVVLKGECVPVTPTSHNTVKLVKGIARNPDGCRAAKLADLGITREPKPMPFTRKPATSEPALTLEAVVAFLQANGLQVVKA